MDRLKNPGLWCAFLVAALGFVVQGDVYPEGSAPIKILTIASQVIGVAGSLFFGAGLSGSAKPAVKEEVQS